jgi:hypothetical protein
MNISKWIQGGTGLVAAVLAALSVTACDPYVAANTSLPAVLGAIVADVVVNGNVPPFYAATDGCTAPYPEPDLTWAASAFPGLCDPTALARSMPTVCPVPCYPPRTGPAYAPFFQGNIGGSYQSVSGPVYYNQPSDGVYRISGVPTDPLFASSGYFYWFAQIRVQFNKLMDPATIQPNPDDSLGCIPAPGPDGPTVVKVSPPTSTATPTPATGDFSICYEPNSSASYYGGGISFTPLSLDWNNLTGGLDPDTKYTITARVKDQQGNPVNVAVTVITDPVAIP